MDFSMISPLFSAPDSANENTRTGVLGPGIIFTAAN